MERALICERLDWQVMPWELDDLELREVRGSLYEMYIYRTFQTYAKDMTKLDEAALELVAWVEGMREQGR